jgi:hypothetical protein
LYVHNERCWYSLWPFGIFNRQLVNFMAIWYILWSFGIFLLIFLCCTKINLATLLLCTANGVRTVVMKIFCGRTALIQCCQMVFFKTKNSNLGKF